MRYIIALSIIFASLCSGATVPKSDAEQMAGWANEAEMRLTDFQRVGIINEEELQKDLDWCEQLKAISTDAQHGASLHVLHWLIQHKLNAMDQHTYSAFLVVGAPYEIVFAGIELDPTGAAKLAVYHT